MTAIMTHKTCTDDYPSISTRTIWSIFEILSLFTVFGCQHFHCGRKNSFLVLPGHFAYEGCESRSAIVPLQTRTHDAVVQFPRQCCALIPLVNRLLVIYCWNTVPHPEIFSVFRQRPTSHPGPLCQRLKL